MNHYLAIQDQLLKEPKAWLITGAAGFIGSNLLEKLLQMNQAVVGLDNFSTGKRENIDEVERRVSPEQWSQFTFYEEDIRDISVCHEVTKHVDYVLHQAALGSVPRSIDDPIATNQNNIDGFLNMLVASRDAKVKRFVYAASSSTYGDQQELPKIEDRIGRPLSPYAVTKYVNELYADVFSKTYGTETIGLRYFNVFGQRQDPNGAYAAVIPKWIGQLINHQRPTINGDGNTSRDFCYIDNAIQANILAAEIDSPDAINQVYNVAYGERTTLGELFINIRNLLSEIDPAIRDIDALNGPERVGDVRHSLADISKAKKLLGYEPAYPVKNGLDMTIQWYVSGSMISRQNAKARKAENDGLEKISGINCR